MSRTVATSIAASAMLGLLLGAAPTAEAHGPGWDRYDNRYHSRSHRRGFVHRDRHMPRWLWRKRGFRHWYFRTSLRYDYHLPWWQLYEAYRWERRFDFRRHYRPRHYDYSLNRHHWRDDRRPKKRRRHRDD